MKQTDLDRISTRQLNRLRRRILRVYGTARREMTEQLTEFLEHYQKLDAYKREQLEAGKITESDYRTWLRNQVFQSEMMHQKLDNITQTCTTAQQTAYKLARDEQYDIFALGANWAFYELEQAAGVAFNLTLYNTEAVKRLLLENPKLVPNKRIKSESNRTYDARVFNRYVMQGIIQGKSVHDIAVQAVQGMADTEVHWAMNNAITALTGAQNAGTMQQLRNAQAIGIEVQKRWNSTLDYRTRETHRLLDQETADLDEPFKVQGYEIQYPGDPNAAPEMVYHCRCKVTGALVKYPRQNAHRRDNTTKEVTSDLTYTEWYKAKGGTEKEQMWWAEEAKRAAVVVDRSRYKKTHNDVVSFVKEQVGVDLNKYRSGDGSSPSHTTYWDKSGPKVAFDLKGMTSSDRTKLMQLSQKPFGVTVEQGGAWIDFVSKKKKKK